MRSVDPAGTAAPTLEPEDRARANLYALVSRLFHAPADPNLLAELARAAPGEEGGEEGAGDLRAAWRELQDACHSAFPALVRQEYNTLFIGVGRAEVTPYLSAYAEPASPDRYVVRLREQLEAWNLSRRDNVFEVEDHLSGVSDVMRWLIENGRTLSEQRQFFESYVYPGAVAFFAAVQKAVSAGFYGPVASFALAFFAVEKAAFEMMDAT